MRKSVCKHYVNIDNFSENIYIMKMYLTIKIRRIATFFRPLGKIKASQGDEKWKKRILKSLAALSFLSC